MNRTIAQIFDIRAGYPFRGTVPTASDGDVSVIQMRDVADNEVAWSALTRTVLAGAKQPDWLRDDDVLFAARGGRNYAVCLSSVRPRTVCAPCFFVLRRKAAAAAQVLPAYLAWHMNSRPSRRYLARNAEGTDQLSIRRAVLEDMPIAMLPLESQQLLVSLAETANQERRCLEALIRSRERQLDALAHRLLSPDTASTEP